MLKQIWWGVKGGGEAGHTVSVIKTVEDFICK